MTIYAEVVHTIRFVDSIRANTTNSRGIMRARTITTKGIYVSNQATDDFPDFLHAAQECGLPSAPSDLAVARFIWKTLDFEQRQQAIAGLIARRDCHEWSDGYKPLPQNYLGKKLWKRPLRVRRDGNGVAHPTDEKMRKLFPAAVEPDESATKELLAWAEKRGLPLATAGDLLRAADLRKREEKP